MKMRALEEPTYELIVVSIAGENHPVLTLKGLKPSNLEKLDCKERLKAYCYVESSIIGPKRWNVDCADMLEIEDRLEKELCECIMLHLTTATERFLRFWRQPSIS